MKKTKRPRANRAYCSNYRDRISALISRLDDEAVNDIIECFHRARENHSTIFFVGNGGSAATASHFAQDLAEIGRKAGVRGFRAVSLTDNMSRITALANDYGYDTIFSAQVAELFKKGDVIVAISASGNSPNVIKAVECAKKLGGTAIGLVGFDGGKLARICDHTVHIETDRGEYGPVEDIHMMLDHMITSNICASLMERG
ncbi:MAG: SIS domain-containing protein [Candidatus Omnitrophota bacterium]